MHDTLLNEFLLENEAMRMNILRSEQKTDGFIHVSSTCNLLEIVHTENPNQKVVFGVEEEPLEYSLSRPPTWTILWYIVSPEVTWIQKIK